MTTIATDGRSMAGDGQTVSSGGTIVGRSARKVVRIRGALVGCSGKDEDIMAAERWLREGCPEKRPKLTEFNGMVLTPIGLWRLENNLQPSEIEAPHTIGTGRDHALTALDLGCTPAEAVAAAALRDINTGGTVIALTL